MKRNRNINIGSTSRNQGTDPLGLPKPLDVRLKDKKSELFPTRTVRKPLIVRPPSSMTVFAETSVNPIHAPVDKPTINPINQTAQVFIQQCRDILDLEKQNVKIETELYNLFTALFYSINPYSDPDTLYGIFSGYVSNNIELPRLVKEKIENSPLIILLVKQTIDDLNRKANIPVQKTLYQLPTPPQSSKELTKQLSVQNIQQSFINEEQKKQVFVQQCKEILLLDKQIPSISKKLDRFFFSLFTSIKPDSDLKTLQTLFLKKQEESSLPKSVQEKINRYEKIQFLIQRRINELKTELSLPRTPSFLNIYATPALSQKPPTSIFKIVQNKESFVEQCLLELNLQYPYPQVMEELRNLFSVMFTKIYPESNINAVYKFLRKYEPKYMIELSQFKNRILQPEGIQRLIETRIQQLRQEQYPRNKKDIVSSSQSDSSSQTTPPDSIPSSPQIISQKAVLSYDYTPKLYPTQSKPFFRRTELTIANPPYLYYYKNNATIQNIMLEFPETVPYFELFMKQAILWKNIFPEILFNSLSKDTQFKRFGPVNVKIFLQNQVTIMEHISTVRKGITQSVDMIHHNQENVDEARRRSTIPMTIQGSSLFFDQLSNIIYTCHAPCSSEVLFQFACKIMQDETFVLRDNIQISHILGHIIESFQYSMVNIDKEKLINALIPTAYKIQEFVQKNSVVKPNTVPESELDGKQTDKQERIPSIKKIFKKESFIGKKGTHEQKDLDVTHQTVESSPHMESTEISVKLSKVKEEVSIEEQKQANQIVERFFKKNKYFSQLAKNYKKSGLIPYVLLSIEQSLSLWCNEEEMVMNAFRCAENGVLTDPIQMDSFKIKDKEEMKKLWTSGLKELQKTILKDKRITEQRRVVSTTYFYKEKRRMQSINLDKFTTLEECLQELIRVSSVPNTKDFVKVFMAYNNEIDLNEFDFDDPNFNEVQNCFINSTPMFKVLAKINGTFLSNLSVQQGFRYNNVIAPLIVVLAKGIKELSPQYKKFDSVLVNEAELTSLYQEYPELKVVCDYIPEFKRLLTLCPNKGLQKHIILSIKRSLGIWFHAEAMIHYAVYDAQRGLLGECIPEADCTMSTFTMKWKECLDKLSQKSGSETELFDLRTKVRQKLLLEDKARIDKVVQEGHKNFYSMFRSVVDTTLIPFCNLSLEKELMDILKTEDIITEATIPTILERIVNNVFNEYDQTIKNTYKKSIEYTVRLLIKEYQYFKKKSITSSELPTLEDYIMMSPTLKDFFNFTKEKDVFDQGVILTQTGINKLSPYIKLSIERAIVFGCSNELQEKSSLRGLGNIEGIFGFSDAEEGMLDIDIGPELKKQKNKIIPYWGKALKEIVESMSHDPQFQQKKDLLKKDLLLREQKRIDCILRKKHITTQIALSELLRRTYVPQVIELIHTFFANHKENMTDEPLIVKSLLKNILYQKGIVEKEEVSDLLEAAMLIAIPIARTLCQEIEREKKKNGSILVICEKQENNIIKSNPEFQQLISKYPMRKQFIIRSIRSVLAYPNVGINKLVLGIKCIDEEMKEYLDYRGRKECKFLERLIASLTHLRSISINNYKSYCSQEIRSLIFEQVSQSAKECAYKVISFDETVKNVGRKTLLPLNYREVLHNILKRILIDIQELIDDKDFGDNVTFVRIKNTIKKYVGQEIELLYLSDSNKNRIINKILSPIVKNFIEALLNIYRTEVVEKEFDFLDRSEYREEFDFYDKMKNNAVEEQK